MMTGEALLDVPPLTMSLIKGATQVRTVDSEQALDTNIKQ